MKIRNNIKDKIQKEMFGLFFEDINFAADGGLYAEMIENRSFEAREAFGTCGHFYTVNDYGYAWSSIGSTRMQYVEGCPVSSNNPHYLRVTTYDHNSGFSNKAYDGITLKKGNTYTISFYARCVNYTGSVKVCIEKEGIHYGKCSISLKSPLPYAPFCDVEPQFDANWKTVDEIRLYRNQFHVDEYPKESEWVYYEMKLEALDDIRHASFNIYLEKGIIEFDLISMIPDDSIHHIFRKDLFEALDSIHPGFIRFPGGCIVEGFSLENRYNWKQTIGDIKDRKVIPNLWAFKDDRDYSGYDIQRKDSHYSQSYGIGFYEYFLLCELLHAKALPVLGIGVACQFRTDEMIDVDDEKFNIFVQDALDLIEFANGPSTSKWGSIRSSMGHEEPFHLEMIAIGNEQWDTKNVQLFKRLDIFEKEIHSLYPSMKIVGTAGPNVNYPINTSLWNEYYKRKTCYAVDEHYYVSKEWLYDHIHLYDTYSREIGVFAGEYACHNEKRSNNMEAALAEASFLTGIERNAGVVKLASYAPLFNRIGHSQWTPDLIWFDDQDVYLTPSYYVQKLYANHVGDYTLEMDDILDDDIYMSSSIKDNGTIIIKVVNNKEDDYELHLDDIHNQAHIYQLIENGKELEALPQPSCIKEYNTFIDSKVILTKKSFTVIEIEGE